MTHILLLLCPFCVSLISLSRIGQTGELRKSKVSPNQVRLLLGHLVLVVVTLDHVAITNGSNKVTRLSQLIQVAKNHPKPNLNFRPRPTEEMTLPREIHTKQLPTADWATTRTTMTTTTSRRSSVPRTPMQQQRQREIRDDIQRCREIQFSWSTHPKAKHSILISTKASNQPYDHPVEIDAMKSHDTTE